MVIGIDPGIKGGISLIGKNLAEAYSMPSTERDIYDLFEDLSQRSSMALIEKVHSMPGQGVASSFKFGQGYGFLRGALIFCKIPFIDISPMKWQTKLNCKTGGNKNVTKQLAQQLYPDLKITHNIADSLLIATYGYKYEHK